MAQNSNVGRLQEDYLTQVSEEIEGRVTKKLSQEFRRTGNRTLARLDGFRMNPLIQGHPQPLQRRPGTHLAHTRERMKSDPHPEVDIFCSQTTQNSGPEVGHDMMTGVHEEFTYCSPSTSSEKQKKKIPSTIQLQFRSENTPATIGADQSLLTLSQLSNNNNSANFHNNIDRISKLPKSLTTTMPTFDGKSEKFELFEDLFQTSLEILNQLVAEDRISYFHSLMKGDALQALKNINGPTREILGEILAVFRRKYIKPQSMATAKHKFRKLVFNPANHKLVDFLNELQKLAKDAFGIAAHAIIEQFMYAKLPPHQKKSMNQAHLESGTYEQIATHLEKEIWAERFGSL